MAGVKELATSEQIPTRGEKLWGMYRIFYVPPAEEIRWCKIGGKRWPVIMPSLQIHFLGNFSVQGCKMKMR
jgi:hypothetical protein